jgi:hypothetical protein
MRRRKSESDKGLSKYHAKDTGQRERERERASATEEHRCVSSGCEGQVHTSHSKSGDD